MQVTQQDIDWTVNCWQAVWQKEGKQLKDGVIIDKNDDRIAIPIEQFINNFAAMGSIFTWKSEMEKFRREAMEQFTINNKQDFAIKAFFAKTGKVDWQSVKLMDSTQCPHKYVMESETQFITEYDNSYFVWDKSTGVCLMKDCEELELLGT